MPAYRAAQSRQQSVVFPLVTALAGIVVVGLLVWAGAELAGVLRIPFLS